MHKNKALGFLYTMTSVLFLYQFHRESGYPPQYTLHTIFYRRDALPHYANFKSAGDFPYPNLLNLVSLDELNRTDQEFTHINDLIGHSTKIHHKAYGACIHKCPNFTC